MCGFVFAADPSRFKSEELCVGFVNKALAGMHYRGLPGRSNVTLAHGRVLGHTRLPIMNLSRQYDQPLVYENLLVAHVGEVFNYRKLFSHAPTDTLTVAETYLRQGVQGFSQFDGFWSTVILDEEKAAVVTDYLAQKPVYWHRRKQVFASELNVLKPLGVTLNRHYLSNVAKWGYDPTGRTPYNEITQLAPGHAVIFYGSEYHVLRYWNWDAIPLPQKNLFELLLNAVELRLLGDQPVAALVSGGLDSAITYGLALELGAQIATFHVENDEADFARLVSRKAVPLNVHDVSIAEGLEAHQVPVDLGSVLPQLAMARAVQERGFHVALTGDGADELFGGYRRAKQYDSQWSDTFTELPYYHLPRLDRIMMRHTIELRSPFLAPAVIKYALKLPYEERTEKQALKSAFRNIVPDEVLAREKKPLKSFLFDKDATSYRLELLRMFTDNFEKESHEH